MLCTGMYGVAKVNSHCEETRSVGAVVGGLRILVCKGLAKERCCVPQLPTVASDCHTHGVRHIVAHACQAQPLPRVLESR